MNLEIGTEYVFKLESGKTKTIIVYGSSSEDGLLVSVDDTDTNSYSSLQDAIGEPYVTYYPA